MGFKYLSLIICHGNSLTAAALLACIRDQILPVKPFKTQDYLQEKERPKASLIIENNRKNISHCRIFPLKSKMKLWTSKLIFFIKKVTNQQPPRGSAKKETAKHRTLHIMTPKFDSKLQKRYGENLRRTRTDQGLTQKQLADKLGCCSKTVRNYEKGVTEIPQSVRLKVLALYGVDILPTPCPNEISEPVVNHHQEMQQFERLKSSLVRMQHKTFWIAWFWQLREKTIHRTKHQIGTTRRVFEGLLIYLFCLATFVQWVDRLKRKFGGWENNQAYYDTLQIGSLVAICFLMLPTLMTIPWGTKSD